MRLATRRVPAWWVAIAAAAAAVIAVAGPAIAGSDDPVERMRAQLTPVAGGASADSEPKIVGGRAAARGGAKVKYRSAAFASPPNSQRAGGVRCPAGAKAISGGVISESNDSGDQAINSSFPFGDDGNNRQDDGWIGVVDNTTLGESLSFGVFVICRDFRNG